MKFKVKTDIVTYDVKATCDRCKRPIDTGNRHTLNEVRVEARFGSIFPEGDMRNLYETDCCTECWPVAKAALQAVGFVFRRRDSEEDPEDLPLARPDAPT